MTPEEQARAFNAASAAQAGKLPRIQRDMLAEIVKQLQKAEATITAALSANPSESAQRRLLQLRQQVEAALHAFQNAAIQAANGAADSAWQAAINSIAIPAEAAGVGMLGPRIDAGALMAAKRLMTTRIADLSLRALNRLNATLMQNLIGAQSLSDTITDVQRILHGATRSRAMTVTYTEVGRAHSIAQQAAMDRDAALVPNLAKKWLHSHKRHPRLSHIDASGQTVAHDQPFVVDGEKLMYPRDPNGSARNTINCGCLSIPVVDGSSFRNLKDETLGVARVDGNGRVMIETPKGRLIHPKRPPPVHQGA